MLDLGDKKVTGSLTIIGAAIFAAVQTAEALGQVPAGAATQLAVAAKGIAGLVSVFGLRRAIGQNGLLAPDEEDPSLEEVARGL